MPAKSGAIDSWTIRLKHQKTTILLEEDPHATIETLKKDLIHALNNVKTPSVIAKEDKELPTHTRQILLARPKDPTDATQGWQTIDYIPASHEQMDELAEDQLSNGAGKGKGKAKARATIATSDALGPLPPGDSRTLLECKLSDRCVVAFTWTTSLPDDDGELELNEEEVELDAEGHPVFDVTIPTMEDVYGVENEGDVGVYKEFRG